MPLKKQREIVDLQDEPSEVCQFSDSDKEMNYMCGSNGPLKEIYQMALQQTFPLKKEKSNSFTLKILFEKFIQFGLDQEPVVRDNSSGRSFPCKSLECIQFFTKPLANSVYSLLNRLVSQCRGTYLPLLASMLMNWFPYDCFFYYLLSKITTF